jgi:hypothetical protein
MFREVRLHLRVGIDATMEKVFASALLEVGGGCGDQALDIELIRINEKADERLLVVRFIGEIGENHHPRPLRSLGGMCDE